MSAHATLAIEASGLEVQALPGDRAAGSGGSPSPRHPTESSAAKNSGTVSAT
jgi:hypothetical protein